MTETEYMEAAFFLTMLEETLKEDCKQGVSVAARAALERDQAQIRKLAQKLREQAHASRSE